MTTQKATKIEVLNSDATTAMKKAFSPKQWHESLRQYVKRKHKMDISEQMKRAEITLNSGAGKENGMFRVGHRSRRSTR